jgi:multiple sugar transport system substrate-binding protein
MSWLQRSSRRRWHRRAYATGSVLATVALVAACGSSGGSSSSTGSAGKTTITVWADTGVGPVGAGPAPSGWKAVTAAFEKANPNISVNWKNYSPEQNPASYQTLLTAIAGGKGPDVAAVDRFLTYEFALKGAIEPIQPYLSTNSVVYKETKLIPGASFEQNVNGKLYGITFPWQAVGFWSLCYNKSMFATAHLSPPTDWAQVVTDTKMLTKKSGSRYTQLGYEPYPLDDTEMWYYSEPNPTPLVSTNGAKANLASPDATKAVGQFVKVMNAEGGYSNVSKFANPASTLPSQDPFYTGHAAMDDCGDWYLQTIAQYYPKLSVGVVPLPSPQGGKPYGWAGGWSFQLTKGSHHPKQAAAFMQYLMSEQASKVFEDAYTGYNAAHKLPNVIIGAITFMYPKMVKADMASLDKASPNLYQSVQHFLNVPQTYAGVNHRPHTVAAGELFTDFNNAGLAAALGSGSPAAELAKQNSLLQASITADQ